MSGKVIIGTGSYVPDSIVSNDEIERTSLDWDAQRAGMSIDGAGSGSARSSVDESSRARAHRIWRLVLQPLRSPMRG
jgi:hypothetical protein